MFLHNHFNIQWVDSTDRKKTVKYHLYRVLDAFLCFISLGQLEGNYAFDYIFSDEDE